MWGVGGGLNMCKEIGVFDWQFVRFDLAKSATLGRVSRMFSVSNLLILGSFNKFFSSKSVRCFKL